MNNWKEFTPNDILTSSKRAWQKKILKKDNESIYANIYEYLSIRQIKKSYELEIQIPEELSKTGMTTNVKSFAYGKIDFDKMEKHSKILIKSLII